MREAGAFGEPEEWVSFPEAVQQELLDGLGAVVDAAGGTFTMSYTTIAATAARLNL